MTASGPAAAHGDTLKLPYRVGLMSLVLFNVVFVQLTNAVGGPWLVGLYVATLGYPLWWRCADSPSWRFFWNCCVLGLFVQLLWRASTTGVRHLLESGMLLAVFCQVHLLNVLQRRQNADLVFFNSFLIALVTSFFVQDAVYSMVFIGYAFAFVLSLHLNAIAFGDHEIERSSLRAVGPQALLRAGCVIATTAVLFLVVPRDFRREGLVGDEMAWTQARYSGYTEDIQLGRSGNSRVSDRIVLRLTAPDRSQLGRIPTHWRGATAARYADERWEALRAPWRNEAVDPPWEWVSANERARYESLPADDDGSTHFDVEVLSFDRRHRNVFVPAGAVYFRVPDEDTASLRPNADGTVLFPRPDRRPVHPEQESALWWVRVAPRLLPPEPELTAAQRQRYTAIDQRDVPPAAVDLLDEILPPGTPRDRDAIVAACSTWLYENKTYLLPGEQGSAQDLQDFFAGAEGGHCEYFATALAVMLRMYKIPCRVVTGYVASERDPETGGVIVRDKHAHAWVEVWKDGMGWTTQDPTPAVAQAQRIAAEEEHGNVLMAWLNAVWARVTGMSADDRQRALEAILAFPGKVALALAQRPGAALGLAFVLAAAVYALHRRRESRLDARARARRTWRRALRAARLRPERTETPREVLARARRTDGVSPQALERLEQATAEHQLACYASSRTGGGASPANPQV